MTAKIRAKQRSKAVRALRRIPGGVHRVKVGLTGGANPYPDGTSVIDVGILNEFGAAGVPERSFLRAGIREGKPEYRKMNRRNLKAITRGDKTAKQALGELGLKAQGDVQEMIAEVSTPPNAPATIARKGSANPLVDTGHMRQSITHEVIK